MAAIENEKIYALKIRESLDDGSDFGTPDADYRYLFVGEDGDIHLKDAADAVTDFPAGGSAGGPVSGELDYAEITSPVSVTSTTEGTPDAIITGASVTCENVPYMIEVFFPYFTGANGVTNYLLLYVDSTVIGRVMRKGMVTGALYSEVFIRSRYTPTAGNHTFSVKGFCSATGYTAGAGAGGSGTYVPAFLRVVKA